MTEVQAHRQGSRTEMHTETEINRKTQRKGMDGCKDHIMCEEKASLGNGNKRDTDTMRKRERRKRQYIYIRSRNQASWACRKAARQMERKVAAKAKHNPKVFWSYVS